MVDPLEAKRLAAKQMELVKAKEKFNVSEIPFWLKTFCGNYLSGESGNAVKISV